MLVPAAIYIALNRDGPGAAGWGIPMATDIAFAVGVLTLLRSRVPPPLPVFLLALAVFDDLGGILVIALFYGQGIHLPWLLFTAGVLGLVGLAGRLRLTSGLVYGLLGSVLWWAMHQAASPARSRRGLRDTSS